MSRRRKPTLDIDIRKASAFAIIVNIAELLVLLVFVVYLLFLDRPGDSSEMVQALAVISAVMAGWGAVLDIRQALLMSRRAHVLEELQQINQDMDLLNHTLRAQRHDFLGHLQVVYSLMEMGESQDASDYLEKVYGEIRAVSAVLRTDSTAVNALLQVKAAACKDADIRLQLNITSSLKGISLPPWELCRVLSNLLDNAMEAVRERRDPLLTLDISENLKGFTFAVFNNGAPVARDKRETLFDPGVSTKGEGRGMGLFIVKETLLHADGEVSYESDERGTTFTVFLPKPAGSQ